MPLTIRGQVNGLYVTFVVDDVDLTFQKTIDLKHKGIQEPEDTFYGQRRMLLENPNGNVLDISSPIKNT